MGKLYLLSFLCCFVFFSSAYADTPRYRVTKITDGKQKSQGLGSAFGLNNHGDVVGRADARAFVWRQGKLTLLEMPEESQLHTAYHINDSRQVVGTYESAGRKGSYFFWDNGKIQKLGEAPWEIAYPDINNKGQAIFPIVEKNVARTILWQNGRKKDLGAFGAIGINDHTQIVGVQNIGRYDYVRSSSSWGVIWESGQVRAAGSGGSLAVLINNNRDYLIGKLMHDILSYYLVRAGKRINITPPDKTEIQLDAINDKCQLVGHAFNISDYYAVLWDNGQWLNLNDLIPKNSGWVLWAARDINEKGQIVGSGTYNGVASAFLLTPTTQG